MLFYIILKLLRNIIIVILIAIKILYHIQFVVFFLQNLNILAEINTFKRYLLYNFIIDGGLGNGNSNYD